MKLPRKPGIICLYNFILPAFLTLFIAHCSIAYTVSMNRCSVRLKRMTAKNMVMQRKTKL